MFVLPTQLVVIFGSVSTPFGTLAIHGKFYGDRPRRTLPSLPLLRLTPPTDEFPQTISVKYSDFGPIAGYVSETVQDKR